MIDTHCHINDQLYLKDSQKYINDAQAVGVNKFIVVGFDIKSSIDAVNISKKHDCCFASVGIHPSEVNKEENTLEQLEELILNNNVVSVGEIGLDYYWEKDIHIRDLQKKTFILQIQLANKYNLPIIIHCRDALQDCLDILKKYPAKRGGIMHCYAGSVEMSREFIELGFVLGIGGVVTFKNSQKLKDVVCSISNSSYVLETDAPYLTPVPHRGEPNHSKYLYLIRDEIARLKNISASDVESYSTKNFERIFYEKNN